LKIERDQSGRADEQQVIRHDFRVDVAGGDAMALIPRADLLALLVVEHLETIAGLLAAGCDQGLERGPYVLRRVFMENDSPTRLLQFLWPHVIRHGERAGFLRVQCGEGFAPGVDHDLFRYIVDRAWLEGILSRLEIYAVYIEEIVGGGCFGFVACPRRQRSSGGGRRNDGSADTRRTCCQTPPTFCVALAAAGGRSIGERQQFVADVAVVLIGAPAGGRAVTGEHGGAGAPQRFAYGGRRRGADDVAGRAAQAQDARIKPSRTFQGARVIHLPPGADEVRNSASKKRLCQSHQVVPLVLMIVRDRGKTRIREYQPRDLANAEDLLGGNTAILGKNPSAISGFGVGEAMAGIMNQIELLVDDQGGDLERIAKFDVGQPLVLFVQAVEHALLNLAGIGFGAYAKRRRYVVFPAPTASGPIDHVDDCQSFLAGILQF
jgi:hypothetical protein